MKNHNEGWKRVTRNPERFFPRKPVIAYFKRNINKNIIEREERKKERKREREINNHSSFNGNIFKF